ncbi:hypothetical protein ACLKA6_004112 [Drosophila palustris]
MESRALRRQLPSSFNEASDENWQQQLERKIVEPQHNADVLCRGRLASRAGFLPGCQITDLTGTYVRNINAANKSSQLCEGNGESRKTARIFDCTHAVIC